MKTYLALLKYFAVMVYYSSILLTGKSGGRDTCRGSSGWSCSLPPGHGQHYGGYLAAHGGMGPRAGPWQVWTAQHDRHLLVKEMIDDVRIEGHHNIEIIQVQFFANRKRQRNIVCVQKRQTLVSHLFLDKQCGQTMYTCFYSLYYIIY